MSLDDARRSWINDEPTHKAFGAYLHEQITRAIRELGIIAEVTYRTKTIDSLLRKLFTKPHHTYETLPDKLGLRIVVRYQQNVDEVINALHRVINCQDIDTKADKLDPDQLGYRATHLQIGLYPTDTQSNTYPSPRFIAELQIQTHAQHLWAEMAHDVFYKDQQTTSSQLQRRIYLLAGLVEVADNEFSSIERDIATMPDLRNVQILRALERQYYKLAATPGNTALSLQIIDHLTPCTATIPATGAHALRSSSRRSTTCSSTYSMNRHSGHMNEARSSSNQRS
jgi:putative GTP pyrophosphokinase